MQQHVGGPEGQQLVRYSGGAAAAAVLGSVARDAADDGWEGHAVSARVGGIDVASWPVGGKKETASASVAKTRTAYVLDSLPWTIWVRLTTPSVLSD